MSRKTLGHGCRSAQGPIRSGTGGDLGRDSLRCACSRAAQMLDSRGAPDAWDVPVGRRMAEWRRQDGMPGQATAQH